MCIWGWVCVWRGGEGSFLVRPLSSSQLGHRGAGQSQDLLGLVLRPDMGQAGPGQAPVRNHSYDQIPNLGLNKPPAHSPTDSSEGLLGTAGLNLGRGNTGPRRRWTGPDIGWGCSVSLHPPHPGSPFTWRPLPSSRDSPGLKDSRE